MKNEQTASSLLICAGALFLPPGISGWQKKKRRKRRNLTMTQRLYKSNVNKVVDGVMGTNHKLNTADTVTFLRIIEISERRTVDDHEERDIHIYYNFVGYIEE